MAADSERRQRRVGTVVSNRSDKTIAVRVEAVRRHPIYRKPVRIPRKLLAHESADEDIPLPAREGIPPVDH